MAYEGEIYYHLKKQPDGSGLLDYYSAKELDTIFVIAKQYNEHAYNYRLCYTTKHIENLINETPEKERLFHEVIFEGRQKMRFDLDIKNTDKKTKEIFMEEAEKRLAQVLYGLCVMINALTGDHYIYREQQSQFMITESHCDKEVPTKASFHIITPNFCVESGKDAKIYFGAMCDVIKKRFNYTEDELKEWLDGTIYNMPHNFRLLGGCKTDGRVKKIAKSFLIYDIDFGTYSRVESANWHFEDSLINYCRYCIPFQALSHPDAREVIRQNYSNEEVAEVMKYVMQKTQDFIYGGKNRLKRVKAGLCYVCNKKHEHSDAYFVVRNGGVLMGCFRSPQYNNGKYKTIELKPIMPVEISKIETLRNAEKIQQEFITLPEFAKGDLYIKSPTGTGKTEAFIEYLKDSDESVLYLTQRRNTGRAQMERLSPLGFIFYLDENEGWKNAKRLVLQMESVGRLNSEQIKKYDIIVLDEFMSILTQLDSPNFICEARAIANITRIFSMKKKLLIMDAYLDNERIDDFRERFRKDIPYKIYENTFKNKQNERIIPLENASSAWAMLKKQLGEKKRVFMTCDTKRDVKLALRFAKKQCGLNDAEIIAIHGGNSHSDAIQQLLKDVNTNWKKRLVVINTCIENGVSFSEEWFDCQISLFRNGKIALISHLQMLNRVRTKISNTNYIFYGVPNLKNAKNAEQIKDEIIARGCFPKTNKNEDDICCCFLVPMEDGFELINHPFALQKIANMAYFESISVMRKELFWGNCVYQGYKIESMENVELEENDTRQIRMLTLSVKALEDKLVADSDEKREILEPKTEEDMAVLQKRQICETYGIKPENITPLVVKDYGSWDSMRSYKTRMRRLHEGSDDFVKNEQKKMDLSPEYWEQENKFWSIVCSKKQTPAQKIIANCLLESILGDYFKEAIEKPDGFGISRNDLISSLKKSPQISKWKSVVVPAFGLRGKVSQCENVEQLAENFVGWLKSLNQIFISIFGVSFARKNKHSDSQYGLFVEGFKPKNYDEEYKRLFTKPNENEIDQELMAEILDNVLELDE